MTPTNKLRFVEREVLDETLSTRGIGINKTIRVLQQWWEDQSTDVHWVNGNPGEWRDVPLETEEA